MKEAEPALEQHVRSGYRTVVAFARRGEGERAAYNLARCAHPGSTATRPGRRRSPARARCASPTPRCARASSPPGCSLAVIPEHRLFRRRRAERVAGRAGARRRGRLASFTELRAGDIVVHEDHGLARFAGFDTKTVGDVTRDYLELEYAGTDKVLLPSTSSRRSRATSAPARRTRR